MNWMDKMERKLGRLAIPHLMYYIIGLNFLFFCLIYLDRTGSVISFLRLDPELVLQGQLWRLISFIFIPPTFDWLWIVFTLYFYYMVGGSLENEWGSFRFNLYYLVGMLATITAAFVVGGSTGIFLNMSLFLAFAYLFPDYQLLLFFIIPVKVKYLAILYWIGLGWAVIFGSVENKVAAVASVVNFFVFFGVELVKGAKHNRQSYDRRKKYFEDIGETPTFHTCAVCGKTEKTHPKMDFSYCKVCEGEWKYCAEHINEHSHHTEKLP